MQDEGSPDSTLSDVSFRKYIGTIERLIRSVEARCRITQEDPRLSMIAEQVAVRSLTIATSTMRFELSSCRTVLRQALDDRAWPASLSTTDWVARASRVDIEQLLSAVSAEPKDIKTSAEGLVTDLMQICQDNGEDEMDPESPDDRAAFTRRIASFVKAASSRVANRAYSAFTFEDWERIEMSLSDRSPEFAIASLHSKRPDIDGLLRLYIAMIFMSGIRPVEVMSSMLLVPDLSRVMTPEDIRLLHEDPGQAIDNRLTLPVEKVAAQCGIDMGRAAWMATVKTGAPCILVVRNVKRTNANKDLQDKMRMQIIDGAPMRDLALMSWATQIRGARLNARQWDTLRAGMLKRLKDIVDKEPGIRRKEVNLYSFRHAFVDRVRAAYDRVEESAALTGHTSRTTLSGYGEKGRTRTGGGGGWVPKPDPKRVAEIRSIWFRKDGPEAAPSATPKDD